MKKVIVSVSIAQDLKEFLDKYAEEKRISRSTVLVLLLTKLKEKKVEIVG